MAVRTGQHGLGQRPARIAIVALGPDCHGHQRRPAGGKDRTTGIARASAKPVPSGSVSLI